MPEKIALNSVAAKASSEASSSNNHCLPLPFLDQMKAGIALSLNYLSIVTGIMGNGQHVERRDKCGRGIKGTAVPFMRQFKHIEAPAKITDCPDTLMY